MADQASLTPALVRALNRDWAAKGTEDCGDHEWYNHDGVKELCHHCEVAVRPYDRAHFRDA